MNSIEDMVDVNTIIGEPIEAKNNILIIPISKVCFGFAAGGSEFKGETVDEYSKKAEEEMIQYRLPFGGGSGAGVHISPVAFLVVQENNVKLLPVNHSSAVDKLLDYVPDLCDKLNETISKSKVIKTKITGKENITEDTKESQNTRKRPKRQMRKANAKYEFTYDDTKPETYMDDEEEYMMDEDKMDD